MLLVTRAVMPNVWLSDRNLPCCQIPWWNPFTPVLSRAASYTIHGQTLSWDGVECLLFGTQLWASMVTTRALMTSDPCTLNHLHVPKPELDVCRLFVRRGPYTQPWSKSSFVRGRRQRLEAELPTQDQPRGCLCMAHVWLHFTYARSY